MALVELYVPADMTGLVTWYGQVVQATSTQIVIASWPYQQNYYGSFSYDLYGNVYGTLLATEAFAFGQMTYRVTQIYRDAYTVTSLINSGNATGAAQYVLSGADTILGSAGADVLLGHDGNDHIRGGGDNDTLLGGAGDDLLNGGAGRDVLSGQAGNDVYIVTPGDTILEFAGGGRDTVKSAGNCTLPAETEVLVLTGASGARGIGNELANVIIGNGAANLLSGLGGRDVMSGGGGPDTLRGGAGADKLTGGTGADVFLFAALSERGDTITDFSPVDDTIQVRAASFGGGLTAGMDLGATGRFALGATATAAVGQFLYDQPTGRLWWDGDGTGTAKTPLLIATLSNHAALTAADIAVIA
jgi:Ca2+-binding RTX toxin-like protein